MSYVNEARDSGLPVQEADFCDPEQSQKVDAAQERSKAVGLLMWDILYNIGCYRKFENRCFDTFQTNDIDDLCDLKKTWWCLVAMEIYSVLRFDFLRDGGDCPNY